MSSRNPKLFTVLATRYLTPNMIRITLTGPEIAMMDPKCYGANCKIFLPAEGQSRDTFEQQLRDGPRPVVRTYTVRQLRTDAQEMDIDFVYHGDEGPASAWAARAKIGDFCGFGGPGPVKVTSFYADNYLIVADMSALPVAAATLEAMPDDATGLAIFEIMSEADRQDFRIPVGVKTHWIVNDDPHVPNAVIPQMIAALEWPAGTVQTCIAGESGMIKTLRHSLLTERNLPKEDCYISGYWKIGLKEDEHQKLKRAENAAA